MKQELRTEMRKRLKAAGEIVPEADVYMRHNSGTLFIYMPHGCEIGIEALVNHAIRLGITVAAPRVSGTELCFHRITAMDGQLNPGAYGIREPREEAERLFPSPEKPMRFPVQILIPGLAFDRAGNRLGRGAGYYDRFLSTFLATWPERRNEISLVGVCHSFQIVDRVPTDSHDIPVDCLLTEKGCIVCSN